MSINNNKNSLLLFLSVIIVLFPFATYAEDIDTATGWKPFWGIAGADTAASYSVGDCSFYVYDDYVVVAHQLKREIGSDIYIKSRKQESFPAINCKAAMKNSDMQVLNRWAEFFVAKKDHFLFVRSENGRETKLIIYNIRIKQKIFESDFSEPAYFNAGGKFCFWVKTDEADAGNCPQYNKLLQSGLHPVIETEVNFDLPTQDLFYSDNTRCEYRE